MSLKHHAKKLLENRHHNFKLLIAAVGVVMVWRSIWDFLDLYLFPNDFLASNVAGFFIGLTILLFNDKKILIDEL